MVESTEEFKELLIRAHKNVEIEDMAALFAKGMSYPLDSVDDLLKFMKVRNSPASGAMILPLIMGMVLGATLLNDNPVINEHGRAIYRLAAALNPKSQDIIPNIDGNHPLAEQTDKQMERRGTPRGYQDVARLVNRTFNAMMEYLTGDPYWYKMSDYKEVSGQMPRDFGPVR